MKRSELVSQIFKKKSFLCVGLDTDPAKIPPHLLELEDPVFEFNKAIIDSTKEYCVAYKPNIAFYEALGVAGWKSLEKTINYIPKTHFTIADAKRGDIGNTSRMYAKAMFESMNFDSITVAPYMGIDSVQPFLEFEEKWVILLALTSNKGSQDFQLIEDKEGVPLYKKVLSQSQEWGSTENLMYVVGATHPDYFKHIRAVAPDHFLLVPGVGAQGGDLHGVCEHGLNADVGLLVNSSRGIIYASNGKDFGEAAGIKAKELADQMKNILAEREILST